SSRPCFTGPVNPSASRTKSTSIVISVPARYIHSPAAIMDLGDFENALALAREALMRLPEALRT
ncbi:MAG: hypothetical protein ACHQ1F_03190, partial [Spirochaetia bacterium]